MSLSIPLPDDALEAIAEKAAEIALQRQESAPAASYLNARKAADYIACEPKRIYKLVSTGRIPHHREGGRLLFIRQELDAWIQEGRAA